MPFLVAGAILLLAALFSMLGLGGSMLYVPLFKWVGYDFKSVAIPLGLLLNGVTALSASIYYLRAKMVDVRGAIPLVVTSFIGAPIGAVLTKHVPTRILIILFIVGMIVAAVQMLRLGGQAEPTVMMPGRKRMVLSGVAGLGIGMIAGLLGLGGGFLIVPILIAMGYPTKKAAATSAFVVVFSSFSGFAGHVAEGHFEPVLMLSCLVAVVIGSQLGAKLMNERMKARQIRQMFGVVLLLVAFKLSAGLF